MISLNLRVGKQKYYLFVGICRGSKYAYAEIFDRMKGDGERTYALVVREKAVAMFPIASFVKHNLLRTKTKVHVSKIITIVKLSLF